MTRSRTARRVENAIHRHLRTGTLLRQSWGDGKNSACLFSALVPGARSTEGCPPGIMPQWLAEITPWISDATSAAGWEDRMYRFGTLAYRWRVLTDAQWERVRREFLAFCIADGLTRASKLTHGNYWPVVQRVCREIINALRSGRDPSAEEHGASELAARSAKAAHDKAPDAEVEWQGQRAESLQEALYQANPPAEAAYTAKILAQGAGCAAVESMVTITALIAYRATTTRSRDRARTACWDRMADRLLKLIEAEIARNPGTATS